MHKCFLISSIATLMFVRAWEGRVNLLYVLDIDISA